MNCYKEVLKFSRERDYENYLYFYGSKTGIKKFLHHIDILAEYFEQKGIKKGEAFTIYMPNSPQSFAAFYALNKIGAIANIVHPLTPINTLKRILEQTKSKGILALNLLAAEKALQLNELGLIIILAKPSDYIKGAAKLPFMLYESVKGYNCRKIKNKTNYRDILLSGEKNFDVLAQKEREEKDEEDFDALYIHSGGTSGETKTIVLTNRAVLAISKQTQHIQQEGKDKFTPVVLPIFHAYGLAACVHSSLVLGYNQIIFPKFNAKKINCALKKYNVTAIISVPLMISKMMKEKNFYSPHLKKLDTVYCGGDVVTKSLQEDFNAAVKEQGGSARLLAGYGLTEVCGVASVNTDKDYKFGSVGKALPDVNIQIWENGAPVAVNQTGEIVIGGPTVMKGYLDGANGCMVQGKGISYVKTGDIGHLDEEGFLYINGRKKSLIKIAAYNIFPSEIEETVLKLPFIREACAIEKKIAGKSAVKLIISLNEGVPYIKKLRRKIWSHCEKYLLKYSIPKEIQIVKELPRTSMSKVDIIKVNELYGDKEQTY